MVVLSFQSNDTILVDSTYYSDQNHICLWMVLCTSRSIPNLKFPSFNWKVRKLVKNWKKKPTKIRKVSNFTWSCSKSYSSWSDKCPSLVLSRWPNIHFASGLQTPGKRAVYFVELKKESENEKIEFKKTFRMVEWIFVFTKRQNQQLDSSVELRNCLCGSHKINSLSLLNIFIC